MAALTFPLTGPWETSFVRSREAGVRARVRVAALTETLPIDWGSFLISSSPLIYSILSPLLPSTHVYYNHLELMVQLAFVHPSYYFGATKGEGERQQHL